ncbi:ATP-binding protein [Streptomyces broussonetiae]|uniref:ATP-binding protein n=1 Tax=Streptomyces broussonetiae TaxID=2686304 RepID=A0A6I6NFU4_9ACTN|nr:ATP-binding protein [Streptomyces broussonetiae]QHA07825.1 ATP-binding protein [Streptomyces broussonetiae]
MTAHDALGAPACVLLRWTSCTPDAAAQARATLRCALAELGYGGEVISNAVLAVSEFVTNAITHAVGPYEMRLRHTSAGIICEVEDRDPRIPEVPAFPATAPYTPVEENRGGGLEALCTLLSEHGRGLHIVHELTGGAWGFRGRKRVKTAWFAVSVASGGRGKGS